MYGCLTFEWRPDGSCTVAGGRPGWTTLGVDRYANIRTGSERGRVENKGGGRTGKGRDNKGDETHRGTLE